MFHYYPADVIRRPLQLVSNKQAIQNNRPDPFKASASPSQVNGTENSTSVNVINFAIEIL